MSHRNRAGMAAINLREKIQRSRAGHITYRSSIGPGGSMDTIRDGTLHNVMIGRMVCYLIDTLAKAIMSMQNWLKCIGIKARLYHVAASGKRANFIEGCECPTSPFALNTFNQGGVLSKNIVINQRRGLIEDPMCCMWCSGV